MADQAIYTIAGARGKMLEVYEDGVVISTKPTLGSYFMGTALNGIKYIYYRDVVGIQYKNPGWFLGYLQLETASNQVRNAANHFSSENSFVFKYGGEVLKAYEYIVNRVSEIKTGVQETIS